jgi:hypothetical protein
MKLFDPNNPNEKKKIIAAAVLGLLAIVVLGYVFLGGSSSTPPANNKRVATASPTPVRVVKGQDSQPAADEVNLQPISYPVAVPAVPDADRNVFSFYVPPPPTPTPVKPLPTPTPTPTPPLMVTSVAPANVYARTDDFSLQLSGDKFTPAVHIVMDGRDMPTRFVNAQQLFTTVPASMIANPGPRSVMARSNDGRLYSNSISLIVTPPPVPNFTYVGLIAKPRGNDTAVLLDKNNKELINAQRGDPLGGRFRIISISEKEVVVVDTNLKIKTRLPFTVDPNAAQSGQPFRPPSRVADEEP